MTGLHKALLVFGPGIIMLLALLSFEKSLRKGDNSRLYLVFFLFVSALFLGAHGLGYFAQPAISQWSDALKIPLELAVIPLFFMFLNGIITGNNVKRDRRWHHLALPVIFLVTIPVVMLINSFSGQSYAESGLISVWISTGHVFLLLQTLAYMIRIFTRNKIYSKMLQTYYAKSHRNFINLRYLLISFSAFFLFLDSWLMSFVIPAPEFPLVYSAMVFVAASFTGWFGLNANAPESSPVMAAFPASVSAEIIPVHHTLPAEAVVTTATMSEEPVISEYSAEVAEEMELMPELVQAAKPRKLKLGISSLRKPFDEQQKLELYKKMLHYLVSNEVYTDPKLTLKQLASDLGTNTRYLSQVINEFQGRNFNQMLNYYRVKKVMRLLVDNEAQSYSYVGLAQKAGFHSKSVFISAFKSQTGTTPSEFSGTMKKLIQA